MTEFAGVVGHARPTGILLGSLAGGRVHHAYLFAGLSGIGKCMVALRFAQALNCLAEGTARPCGSCTHCTRIERSEHPDVTLIEPDRSKARPVVKIEVVRNLIRQVHFKPYEGNRRVIIIDDAETVNEQGSNALLKTLEEPSGETVFILVTSQLQSMLPTIRSRCQIVRFAPLSRQIVMDALAREGVELETARVAAAFSGGSLGGALRLAKDDGLSARRDFVLDVAAMEAGDSLGPLRLASKHSRTRPAELLHLLDGLKTFYRDVALVRSGASAERVVNVDVEAQVVAASADLTVDEAIGHIGRIGEAQRALTGYVDQSLLLEELLFSLAPRKSTHVQPVQR
jgi:DNA polymerase III subunit delta'